MATKIVEDLRSVADIVGALGLNIAEAQKMFNVDYLNSLERLIYLVKVFHEKMPEDTNMKEVLDEVLGQLAPPRYQYTETTITARMDLAQSLRVGVTGGFGAAFGAVSVNAAFSLGYGYDYKAAAEIRTVIHAREPGAEALLKRAAEINSNSPPTGGTPLDDAITQQAGEVYKQLTGETLTNQPAPANE